MTSPATGPAPRRPAPRAVVRELGVAAGALVAIAAAVAASMVGLILLLYAPH